MSHAFICDAIRTPFGRYGGALSSIRTDNLGALPIQALMERNPGVDWQMVDDVEDVLPAIRATTPWPQDARSFAAMRGSESSSR